jgi:hypothetical protein
MAFTVGYAAFRGHNADRLSATLTHENTDTPFPGLQRKGPEGLCVAVSRSDNAAAARRGGSPRGVLARNALGGAHGQFSHCAGRSRYVISGSV